MSGGKMMNPVVGTEQAGIRPVVVLQTDRANRASPHTIIAPVDEVAKALRAILDL